MQNLCSWYGVIPCRYFRGRAWVPARHKAKRAVSPPGLTLPAVPQMGREPCFISAVKKEDRELLKVIDSSDDPPQLPAFVYRAKINATDVCCIIGFKLCWGSPGWNRWDREEASVSALRQIWLTK